MCSHHWKAEVCITVPTYQSAHRETLVTMQLFVPSTLIFYVMLMSVTLFFLINIIPPSIWFSSNLVLLSCSIISSGLTPHLGGRLWQQYVVDAFTAMEQYRLDWISRNQTTIRSDLYTSVRDVVRRGDNDPSHLGKCVILPASFTGCKRYMSQYYKDSLALCRSIGHPTLFLTMTCNSKWPEIKEMMKHLPGVDICDAPDVAARVFKFKVDQLIDLIRKQNFFGRCIGCEYPLCSLFDSLD